MDIISRVREWGTNLGFKWRARSPEHNLIFQLEVSIRTTYAPEFRIHLNSTNATIEHKGTYFANPGPSMRNSSSE